MRPRGMKPFTAGAIALVIVVIACYLGFTKSIPFRSHFQLRAAFSSSNNIKPNSPVRIAGVEVGKVTSVQPTAKGSDAAVVTMRINDNGRPIHADATAKIRPRIFLEGNFFVDLTAGSADKPVLEDGDTIPATQTATPVQLDQVLKALKAPTRAAAQQTISGLSDAYKAGFAKAFNKSLPDQGPAFKYTSIVLDALLGREPHDLSGVVRDLGTTAAALDRSPPRLKDFLENFDTFANSLAVQRDNLEATVAELPRTLAAAGPALDALNASFPAVRRLAVRALPGVRSSGPAIAALRPFVAQARGLVSKDELRGLVNDLAGATPGLVGVAKQSVPLLGQLRPLASCIDTVILPWSRDTVPDKAFPETGPVYQSAVKWLPGLAGESRSFDANGQWFKVLGSGGVETFQLGEGLFGTSLFPIEGVNPPKPAARPPLRADVPCETQQPPNLATVPGAPPKAMKINRSSPAVLAREAKARATAIAVLRDQLRQAGVETPVLDRDATAGDVQALARKAGNLAQLDVLRRGLPLTLQNIRKAAKR